MTEYTKGPWETAEHKTGLILWVKGGDGKWAALGLGKTGTEAEANARLISAAPDMLEALEEAEAILTMTGFRLYEDLIMRMRTAITKARSR